jgi:hypothetical protein
MIRRPPPSFMSSRPRSAALELWRFRLARWRCLQRCGRAKIGIDHRITRFRGHNIYGPLAAK